MDFQAKSVILFWMFKDFQWLGSNSLKNWNLSSIYAMCKHQRHKNQPRAISRTLYGYHCLPEHVSSTVHVSLGLFILLATQQVPFVHRTLKSRAETSPFLMNFVLGLLGEREKRYLRNSLFNLVNQTALGNRVAQIQGDIKNKIFYFVLLNKETKNKFPNETKSIDPLLLTMFLPFERNALAFPSRLAFS